MSENKDLEIRIKQIFEDPEFNKLEHIKKEAKPVIKYKILEEINLHYDLVLALKRTYNLLNKPNPKNHKKHLDQILEDYTSFLNTYHIKPVVNENPLDIELKEAAFFIVAYEGIGRVLVDQEKFDKAMPYLEKTEFLIESLKPILNLFDPEGSYKTQLLNPLENRLTSYLAKAYKHTNNPKFLQYIEKTEKKINQKIQDLNKTSDETYKFWRPLNDLISLIDSLSDSMGLFNLINPRTFYEYFDTRFNHEYSETRLRLDNYLQNIFTFFKIPPCDKLKWGVKYQKRLENLINNLNTEKLLRSYDPVFERNVGQFCGEGFVDYLNSLFTTLAYQFLFIGQILNNENFKENALTILKEMEGKLSIKQNFFFLSSAYKLLGKYQEAEEINKSLLKYLLKSGEIYKEYKRQLYKNKPNILLQGSNAYIIKFETETSDIYKDFLVQKFLFYDCGLKSVSMPECYLKNFEGKDWVMQKIELDFNPESESHGKIVSYDYLMKNTSLEEKIGYIKKAIDVLVEIQNKANPNLEKLKKYGVKLEPTDYKTITREKIIKRLKPVNEKEFENAIHFLIEKIENQEKCFSHGDYHLENLLKIGKDTVVAVDFERANIIPLLYDLAFLLEQKELDRLSEENKKELIKYFLNKKDKRLDMEQEKNYDYTSLFVNLRKSSISSRLFNSSDDKTHQEDIGLYIKKADKVIDKILTYVFGKEYDSIKNLKEVLNQLIF